MHTLECSLNEPMGRQREIVPGHSMSFPIPIALCNLGTLRACFFLCCCCVRTRFFLSGLCYFFHVLCRFFPITVSEIFPIIIFGCQFSGSLWIAGFFFW